MPTLIGNPVVNLSDLDLFDLPTGKQFSLEMPAVVNTTGMLDIKALLNEHGLPAVNDPAFEWVWKTNRGTLPKRLDAWLRRVHHIKADPKILSLVGNLAARHSERHGQSYCFDFTRNLHSWRAGDFGDEGSCYWSFNAGARDILEDELDAYAVRFYDPDQEYGVARAWAVPVCVRSDEQALILFNGYGYELLDQVRVVSQALGNLPYKRIRLTNEGECSGTLYINGGVGYILGKQEVIDAITSWDFDASTEGYGTVSCHHCGRRVHEEDAYSPECSDYNYCERCYSDLFTFCEHCHHDLWAEEAVHFNGMPYCESCLEDVAAQCCECDEYFPKDEVYEVDGECYCEKCCPETYVCDHCGETVPAEGGQYEVLEYTVSGERWCPHCRDHYAHECRRCADITDGRRTPVKPDDLVDGLCPKCRGEAVPVFYVSPETQYHPDQLVLPIAA